VRLVWRAFAIGTIAVPDAVWAHFLRSSRRTCRTACCGGARVEAVRAGAVQVDGDELTARAVVVATDPVTAAALLPTVAPPGCTP
jgi:hypothetical protein